MPSVIHMATYVIETYLSRTRTGELDAATSRLRAAIAAVAAVPATGTTGVPVRHVRSFFVPEDEMCFHVVEAPSIETAAEIGRRASLSPERIVEAEAAPG